MSHYQTFLYSATIIYVGGIQLKWVFIRIRYFACMNSSDAEKTGDKFCKIFIQVTTPKPLGSIQRKNCLIIFHTSFHSTKIYRKFGENIVYKLNQLQ